MTTPNTATLAVAVIMPRPTGWVVAPWLEAVPPLVAQVVALQPSLVLVPWIQGETLAFVKLAAIALPDTKFLLCAGYPECPVAQRNGAPRQMTWDAYWHGEAGALNAQVLALPNVEPWYATKRTDLPSAHREAAKAAAYRAIGKRADVLIATAGLTGDAAIASDAASDRGIAKTAPWTSVPEPVAAAPAAPAETPKAKRAPRKRAPRKGDNLPF